MVGINVTDQDQTEPSPDTVRTELARAARTAAVGVLTASITHEINQPLTSVLANGFVSRRWLAMEPPNLEGAREAVAEIIRETERACRMIAGIRDLLSKRPIRQ